MRRVKTVADEADSRVVCVIEIEIRDDVDSLIDCSDENPFRARCVDNEARLRAGDQEVAASEAALGERVLGMARGLFGVIEAQKGHGQESTRVYLLFPAQLAVAPVGHRDDQTGLVHAQPRAHLWKGSIGPVIRPGQQTSKGSAPAANRRRGRTAKRLLAVGAEQERNLAADLVIEENKTHGTAPTRSHDPTSTQRGELTSSSMATDLDQSLPCCDRCAKPVHPGRGDYYVVRIDAVADPAPPVITAEDLAIDFDQEFKRLVAETEGLSAQEAMDQVHRRVVLYLCVTCYEQWIENPTAS
jgi:hypothetical protein